MNAYRCASRARAHDLPAHVREAYDTHE
jgi:hypothetical protein